MAKKAKAADGDTMGVVEDYRHTGATRKNNPPAHIAAEGTVPTIPKSEYSYSPRRPPTLRFDTTTGTDKLPLLLSQATQRKLTPDEARQIFDALRTHQPWLEWTGKRESHAKGFAVDAVALHIHERVSAGAILRVAARQDVERSLFADPVQEYHEAVQFYQHDIDWTNRLILGDSLQAMTSLTRREDLGGKVQMIYMDPPYGIKFKSNFQPEVGKQDVSESNRESDLPREPETVRAYRDTWHLGIHSYLTYIRDRLIAARDLLTETGSIFVQINDANVHHVRELMDEVFHAENFVSQINFQTTSGFETNTLATLGDFLLWYAKSKKDVKVHKLYQPRSLTLGEGNARWVLLPDRTYRGVSTAEVRGTATVPPGAKPYQPGDMTGQNAAKEPQPFTYEGKTYTPGSKAHWKANYPKGMERLAAAERVHVAKDSIRYRRFHDDFQFEAIGNIWTDTITGSFTADKVYVVQTNLKVVERCLLLTTDPGDLVLDPTCGSGTTALVAEQLGRRWLTIDTSRVAVAIARQRLLTARFPYYQLRDVKAGVGGGFKYREAPRITLGSIARNSNLDPIVAKHKAVLEEKLHSCNSALTKVDDDLRHRLRMKLTSKEKSEGKKSVTDADRCRWQLPPEGGTWQHWDVPFDTDVDWPKKLQEAVQAYRDAWHAKLVEVNQCIAANVDKEELVDQPEVVKRVVRVSGPFSVEAVQPPEASLVSAGEADSPIGGAPEPLQAVFPSWKSDSKNIEAYLDQMTSLLRLDGVRFPNNKQRDFTRLDRITGSEGGIQAEGRWVNKEETDVDPEGRLTVAVAFGPQYGPVTAKQVENLIRAASRRGYDDLVVAGFSFDGPAQAIIQEVQHPKLRIHIAHIRPDVNPGMAGLLKEQPGSQLFTVFGQPRTRTEGPNKQGEYTVVMEGVDIYDPVANTIRSTEDQKVAAWFLDGDYDGRTFCITQAFFPDKTAWEKLANALGDIVDAERFQILSGTTSLPFPLGKHKTVAVKVIDPRGNEVMQVHRLA